MKKLLIAVIPIAAIIVVVDGWLFWTLRSHAVLTSLYEINPLIFDVDFDQDELPDSFRIEGEELVIRGNDSELARIPYSYLDGTFRTHIALGGGWGTPRLLVFQGPPGEERSSVLAWQNGRLERVSPTSHDKRVLKAMAAADDGGKHFWWSVYAFFRVPTLLILALALTLSVAPSYFVLSAASKL